MKKAAYIEPDVEAWLGKFRFSIPIKVRYCETDMLGHVNNVSYFMYFEQGRVDYFDHLQLAGELFSEKRVCVAADLECRFLLPVYLKEALELRVRVAHIGRSSMDMEYALVAGGVLKATGRGSIVLVDARTGKSMPLPEAAKAVVQSYESGAMKTTS